MRSTAILLVTLSALTSAHPDPRDVHAGLPKLVGGSKFMASLKRRSIFSDAVPSTVEERVPVEVEAQLEARFTQTCGSGVGNCDAGYCCSPEGYCGTTSSYCAAPDCQFRYGPACDANKIPAGASTSSISRPKIGNIPYGGVNTAGIQDCIILSEIAFTYDDGPYIYTKDLLDLLDSYGAKATFFITGNNLGKGEIDDCNTGYPQLIKRMYNSGHQVASHTWSHQDLSTLTTAEFKNQMYYNEMAFRNILGVIPTYMRPPYSSCNTACSNNLNNMGYHVTYFDMDTQGYLNDDPTDIQKSKDIYTKTTNGVNPAQNNFLLVEHDIHYQTVYNLTKFILDTMKTQGWGAPVTVGKCLGDPVANWYRAAGSAIATCATGIYTGNGATPTVASASTSATGTKTTSSAAGTTTALTGPQTISTDASCGGTITCQGSSFGNCCSQHNYCGSTSNYCGTGCQSAFGTCGTSSSSSSSSPSKGTQASSHSSSSSTKGTKTASPSPSTTSTDAHSTSTSASTLVTSADGSCGGTSTNTCLNSGYGNCCSQYGWCGSTTDYCTTGCQAGFGTCSS